MPIITNQFEWTFSLVSRTSGCSEEIWRTEADEKTAYEIVVNPGGKRATLFIEKKADDGDIFRRRIPVDIIDPPIAQEAVLIDLLKAAAQANYIGGGHYEDYDY